MRLCSCTNCSVAAGHRYASAYSNFGYITFGCSTPIRNQTQINPGCTMLQSLTLSTQVYFVPTKTAWKRIREQLAPIGSHRAEWYASFRKNHIHRRKIDGKTLSLVSLSFDTFMHLFHDYLPTNAESYTIGQKVYLNLPTNGQGDI